ncbi:MAG: cryptochrome/photolyase family protein [Flavobacterium sp.]
MQGKKELNTQYSTLRLILGDQLDASHPWFTETRSDVLYAMMEVRSETSYAWHHVQKACAFFAAMERFAATLSDAGHHVIYLRLDDKGNRQGFADNCGMLAARYGVGKFEYQLPDEYRVDVALKAFCAGLAIPWECHDSAHFYTRRGDVAAFFDGRQGVVMETFYRHMRKKHGLLVTDNGTPEGGKWNFDEENRSRLPKGHKPLPPLLFSNDVSAPYARLMASDSTMVGSVDPERFPWPLDRTQGLELLEHFIAYCLPLFGTFQDAMQSGEWSLYHSRLSFCLNVKLLSPREVVAAVIAAWRQRSSGIAINQLEGFLRQIVGWREYMRGIYWMAMPQLQQANHFGNTRPLPGWYWTGETKMRCLKHCIRQSLDYAYAHHIQRLMITGNFALIAGIAPADADFWYLSIYIDALEWVEMPNTRGMSQYADGGVTASKPYAASANYINKMSDYCVGCRYDRGVRTGENACPFNSLYWDFFDRNRDRLAGNPRLGMVYRTWDRMAPSERSAVLERARECLDTIEQL